MKYSESLKKNRDFQQVYKRGTSKANRYLVMYVLPNQHMMNRLGISVSKKVGNSVVRFYCARLALSLQFDYATLRFTIKISAYW